MEPVRIGVIGGSGLYTMPELADVKEHRVETPFGDPSDAIRVGSHRVLVFTPYGTASGGTVYLRGRDGAAYAIRVLGATARTRVVHYDRGTGLWTLR